MAASFPTAVVTSLKEAVNNLSCDLTADVLIGDATINVTSTTGCPSASSFHIENEVIYYTGKTAASFTGCTRGQDGTSAAGHLKVLGGEVIFGPEAHHINQLNEEIVAVQTDLGITGAKNYVAKTGNETVAGIKTFSSSPIVPTPTTDMQAATKKYVDDDISTVQTFTNKRNTKRAYSVEDTATLTPEIGTYDMFTISALAQALNIANHSTSTPNAGDCILINITPDATPRALTYGTNYVAYSGVALPSTTVASKKIQMMFIWLPVGKYSIVWAGQEA